MEIFTGVLMLLAGCGVFMAGMKMMSDGLERSAGKGMKRLFARISDNRLAGVGVGAAATALIQSSAATSVMVIGFVNAGVMTLTQATAIIMGANIGTTVTGVLVSLSALNVSLYASVLAFVGVMMTLFGREHVKRVGGIVCGLGLLFVGLGAMSDAFSATPIGEMFAGVFSAVSFPLALILLGTVFTALIQSSSAATGLIIVLVGSGALNVTDALFIILGTNVGTCITALIAALGTGVNAKRTAFIHLMFNVVGTVVFTALLWSTSGFVAGLLARAFPDPRMQIAWFHVAFNVITTALLLPFVGQLVRLSEKVIKDKGEDGDELKLRYIDDRLLSTPPIAVAQVKKEILLMSELARGNLDAAAHAILTGGECDEQSFERTEARINRTYHAVAKYLIRLASLPLSDYDEKLVGAYHHVISDIERIGDHAEDLMEQAAQMNKEDLRFSDAAYGELAHMYERVSAIYERGMRAFDSRDYDSLPEIAAIEDEVDEIKNNSGAKHIERLNSGDCAVEKGTYYFAVLTAFERISDHIVNIAFSIKNPTGSQSTRADINERAV